MKKRMISFVLIIVSICTFTLGRVGFIALSGNYAVSQGYNSYSVFVASNDAQLYFRNGGKINNNVPYKTAVIRPVTEDLAEINKYYNKTEIAQITTDLKAGYPVTRRINTDSTTLKTLETYYTDTNLSQVISRESSGVLKYLYDDKRRLEISYLIDAKGRLLSGDKGRVQGDYYSKEGYVLTLDKKVQDITFDACKDMQSGCAVVMDVNTSYILAVVNKPDTSYINKAFSQYSVGSVFKVAVAACAIENGVDLSYNCTGSITVGDTVYSCSKKHSHGAQNLKEALANSCNCYFINMALILGAEKLLATSKQLGFDNEINIINSFNVNAASIPNAYDLASKGELALFGFGQGKLTATPLQICSMMCTVANRGVYKTPKLLFAKKEKNSSFTEYKSDAPVQALTADTSEMLLDYLRYVVKYGTGKNADTSARKSAGKTATAQTGQYRFNNELYNTWFAGVYPYDNPKYAIVVMCENGTSGAADCCPIFSTIVENLENL